MGHRALDTPRMIGALINGYFRSATVGGEMKRPDLDLNPLLSKGGLSKEDGGGLKKFGGFDDLADLVAHRPAKEDLIAKGILKADDFADLGKGNFGDLSALQPNKKAPLGKA
ncbi:hypothetical protein HK104_009022 [Borealophlyctis nickersoniae]|nr:hypothetical protein HK104_009022 [Borealophlyctis nickersoniae]